MWITGCGNQIQPCDFVILDLYQGYSEAASTLAHLAHPDERELWKLEEVASFVVRASKRVKSLATWVNGKWRDFDGCLTSSIHDGDKTFRIQGLFNQREKKYSIRVIMNRDKSSVVESIVVARGSDTPPTMEQIFDALIKEIKRLIKPNGGGDKAAGGRSGSTVYFSGGGGSPMSLIHGLMHSQRFLFQEHSWIQQTFELFDKMTESVALTFDMVNSFCSTALAALQAVPLETWMLIGAGIATITIGGVVLAPIISELLTANTYELLTTYVGEYFTTNVGEFIRLLATQEAATILSEATVGTIALTQKLMELEIPEGAWEGLIESVLDVSQHFLAQ